MSIPHLNILQTAIDQYKILDVIYVVGELDAWAIIKTKTIYIPPPGTLHDLIQGLHEIGHIALKHPTRRGPPWTWTILEWKKFIKEEQEAWKFAFQEIDSHEMFIDIGTLHACHGQYKNYVNGLLSL